jgi:hypothetical protein
MRGNIGRSREMKKKEFSVLGKKNLLCFFGVFCRFQRSLRMIHDDLGSNFILYANN